MPTLLTYARSTLAVLLGLFAGAASVRAQTSGSLPQGYDDTEGEGYHWSGWSNAGATQKRFLPARNVYLYANPFAAARTVRRISLRRDSTLTSSFVAFRQTVRWFLSTDGGGTVRQPALEFGVAHGANVREVVGTASTPATIDFKATLAGRGKPAPFDVVVPLQSAFVVPASARTIVFENRHYGSTGAVGDWYVDAYFKDASPGRALFRYVPGTTCIPGSSHAIVSEAWPNARLRTSFASGKPGVPVVGFLGTLFPQPLPLAGTGCWIYVAPLVTLTSFASIDTRGIAAFDWGPVPRNQALVGARIWFQYGAVFSGGPISGVAGLSRASELTIGAGFAPPLAASAVYSYGPEVALRGGPDQIRVADFVAPRAPILRLD